MSTTTNGVVHSSSVDELFFSGEGEDHLYSGEGTVTLPLLGTWEVAKYLGIERSRVARWLDENAKGKQAIGEPVARLKSGPFWTLEQIEEKARQMYLAETRAVTVAPSMVERNLQAWLAERRARRAASAVA